MKFSLALFVLSAALAGCTKTSQPETLTEEEKGNLTGQFAMYRGVPHDLTFVEVGGEKYPVIVNPATTKRAIFFKGKYQACGQAPCRSIVTTTDKNAPGGDAFWSDQRGGDGNTTGGGGETTDDE